MEIIINGSEKVLLDPCSFRYSDYLSLVERIENYHKANIDPKGLISFGMESLHDIKAREKALNIVVCVAFKNGIIGYSNDNAVHNLFVDPFNYDIFKYQEGDKVRLTVVRETGMSIDLSIKMSNLYRFIERGSESINSGMKLNPHMSDETYACSSLFLALKDNVNYVSEFIDKGFASIHTFKDTAFFTTDFHTASSVAMH